jgi:hypothetical protein
MLLHELLTSNHEELVRDCKEKTRQRFEPSEVPATMNHGVPLFLQQLGDTLRLEQATPARDVDGTGTTRGDSEFGRAASLHGAELLRLGYSIDQVVHEYGDVCQSITAMVVELNERISADEFRTLNRCLDDAIAGAVTSFGSARQSLLDDEARALGDRLAAFSDEHRRLVDIATQAYSAIRTGNVGLTGATGTLLMHTLSELRLLGGQSLSESHSPAVAAGETTV